MDSLSLVLYTHSDYKDLWPVLSTSPFPSCQKMCAVNASTQTPSLPSFSVIQYNDALSYSEKVLFLLNSIKTEYIWFMHDNDILQTMSEKGLEELLHAMNEHRIDRLMFGIISASTPTLQTETIAIGPVTNTTPHFITPYDVGPSIWRTSAFKAAMNHVKGMGYRDIETSSIQNFCKQNLQMWGFYRHSSLRSMYCIGRPFPESFQFLHIFVRGLRLEDEKYMDQQENYKKLCQAYPDLCKRGVLGGQEHIRVDFRTV
jgi:hypothetical protein